MRPTPPYPNTQMGKDVEFETTDRKATRRKTTARYGAPKYAYPALDPAVFWRIHHKSSNIFGLRRHFPNAQMGNGGEIRNYRPKQKDAAEHHGTLRNLTGRLNLALPHWKQPYFSGFPPNYVIFYAPNYPFPQHPNG